MSVTTAPMMPVAAANMAQVAIVATASAPGTPDIASSRLLNSRSMMPERSTM